MKKLLPILLSVSVISISANAQQFPIPQGADKRVQTFFYDPSDVFDINAKVGYSTLIQFEKDEIIPDSGGLGMGDSKAWSLEVRANNIFFKPVTPMPDTNMLVVTNKRTYAFNLSAQESVPPTYIARFKYPKPIKKIDNPNPTPQANKLKLAGTTTDGKKIFINKEINTNYWYRGDKQIKPTNVWDDGLFTYLKYAHAGDLPIVLKVLNDGTETLVNTHVDADKLVVHDKGSLYRLRFNNLVGDVSSVKIDDFAKFNKTGTANPEEKRIDK